MAKKKKIVGTLVGMGLALSFFAGGAAVYVSAKGENSSSAEAAICTASAEGNIQRQSDGQNSVENCCGKQTVEEGQAYRRMAPFKGFNGKQQLTEEQIAALEAYAELSKEIYQKYNEQYDALVRAFEAEVNEIYSSVLGERYEELMAEYDGLYAQNQGLVNGFYSSGEYVALKSELDALVAQLAGLTKNSEEYLAVMDEIHAVWGQISVLAGEINSQISLIHTRIVEITAELRTLIKQNKEAIDELLKPVIKQFNTDAQAVQSSLMLELELLKETLGI